LRGRFPDPYRALVLFLGFAGLRIGEASALRVKNLDLTARTVRVVENSPEVGGRKYIGPTKTTKARTVRFGAGLAGILKAHLAAFGTPLDPDPFAFTSPDGEQVRPNKRPQANLPASRQASRNRPSANCSRPEAHGCLPDGPGMLLAARRPRTARALPRDDDRSLHASVPRGPGAEGGRPGCAAEYGDCLNSRTPGGRSPSSVSGTVGGSSALGGLLPPGEVSLAHYTVGRVTRNHSGNPADDVLPFAHGCR
jgi:hypothetical protein